MKGLRLSIFLVVLISFGSGCGAIKEVSKGAAKVTASTFAAGVKVLTYPLSALRKDPKKQLGIASWYGDKYHGRLTANGETYNQFKLTAAHRTLPFNTLLRVTNLKNGKSVMVRINDRGPFIRGRIIDLSYAAAKEIDMVEDGIQKVEVKILQ